MHMVGKAGVKEFNYARRVVQAGCGAMNCTLPVGALYLANRHSNGQLSLRGKRQRRSNPRTNAAEGRNLKNHILHSILLDCRGTLSLPSQ